MYYYKKFGLIPRILVTLIAILYTLLIWLGHFWHQHRDQPGDH